MQDRTTFIIAHRIQSVMNADLILVMDKGRIVQQGTHAELVEQDGIYRQIYDIQTRIEVELETGSWISPDRPPYRPRSSRSEPESVLDHEEPGCPDGNPFDTRLGLTDRRMQP